MTPRRRLSDEHVNGVIRAHAMNFLTEMGERHGDVAEVDDRVRATRQWLADQVTPQATEREFETATIDAAVLLYAARYALGRMSGAAQDMEAAIAANLRLFRDDAGCREALVRDICDAIERDGLGTLADRSCWMRTLGRLEASRGR